MNDPVPSFVKTEGGINVQYKKNLLYNINTPQKSAEQKAGNFLSESETIYLVICPAAWYGIDVFFKSLPPTSAVLFVDFDPFLADFAEEQRPIHIIRTEHEAAEQIKVLLRNDCFRRLRTISLNRGLALNRKLYKQLETTLQKEIESYWQNRSTEIFLARRYMRNLFKNYGAIDFAAVKPLTKINKPVLVIGAGTSTEEVFDKIPAVRKDLFILTVDTVLPRLLRQNIQPDLCICLEAQYYNVYDFFGAISSEFVLFDLLSYPLLIRESLKNKNSGVFLSLTAFSDIPVIQNILSTQEKVWKLPPSGSVGITALFIGAALTNRAVFFCGLDFCYPAGLTHLRGTEQHKRMLLFGTKTQSIYRDLGMRTEPVFSVDTAGDQEKHYHVPEMKAYSQYLQTHSQMISGIYSLSERFHNGFPVAELTQLTKLFHEEFSRKSLIVNFKNDTKWKSPESTAHLLGKRLENLDNLMVSISKSLEKLSTGNKTDIPENFENLLSSENYVISHFPDRWGFQNPTPGLLKRIYISCHFYKQYIQKAIAQICN